ncbi:MAG: hypothetical protein ACRCS8_02830 [Brevinema sp.]
MTEVQFEEIAEELALKHVEANKNDYGHVLDNNNTSVFDIAPNASSHSSSDRGYFNISVHLLEGKDLDTKSKQYGEGGEEAYHIVLR